MEQLSNSTAKLSFTNETFILMDIFRMNEGMFLACVNKHSKHLSLHFVQSKYEFHKQLEKILSENYPNCKNLVTNNDIMFINHASSMVYIRCKIKHTTTQYPINSGLMEKIYGNVSKITRQLMRQNDTRLKEEVINAVKIYNSSIHRHPSMAVTHSTDHGNQGIGSNEMDYEPPTKIKRS